MDNEFIIKVILRMRDEMSTSLARMQKKLEGLGGSIGRQSGEWRSLDRDLKRTGDTLRRVGDEHSKTADKVNIHTRALARLRSTMSSLHAGFTGQRKDVKDLRGEWNDLERNVRRADTRFREAIIAMSAANLQGVLSAVIGLAGGLVAVAGSAERAAIAVGVSFASALAQAVPAIGVFSVALLRLNAIFNVIKQAQLVQQQQSSQAVQAHRREANQTNTLANAYDTLKNAHKGVETAQRNLTNARREAARQLEDLILQEKSARLAAEGASLSQEEAQRALRQAISSGDFQQIAQRQLDTKEAALRRVEANRDATRATQDRSRLVPRGVSGQDNVVSAREQLQQANRAVEQARRGIDEARRHVNEAGDTALASAGKLKFLESQLSSTELKTYKTFSRIYALYNNPKGPVRGITDIIVSSFNDFGVQLEKTLKNPKFIGDFTNLAESINHNIRRLTRTLFSPEVVRQFSTLTKEAARNITPLTTGIINLFHSFLNIAVAARPLLRHIIADIVKWTGEFRKTTENSDKMEKFFRNTRKHFDAWIKLIGAAAHLMQALFDAGSGTGLKIINSLTKAMNDATEWIKGHPQRVKQFFSDVFDTLKVLGSLTKSLGGTLLQLFNPDNAKAFGGFLENVVVPGMQMAVETAGALATVFSTISQNPVVAFIERLGVAMLFLNTIFLGLPKFIVSKVIPAMFQFTAAANLSTDAMVVANVAGRSLAITFLGWVGIVAIVVAALIYLQQRFHIFNKIWDGIKIGAKAILDFLKDHWRLLIVILLGPFGLIIGAIVDNWKKIKFIFELYLKAVFAVVKLLLKPLITIWKLYFDTLSTIVKAGWKLISKPFSAFFKWAIDAGGVFVDTFIDIFSSIGNGIASAFNDGLNLAYKLIVAFINKAVGAFNTVGGLLGKIGIHVPHLKPLPVSLDSAIALDNAKSGKRNTTTGSTGAENIGANFNFPGAATGAMVGAQPGGRIFRVGEGGYDEVILSTDPKHRSRTGKLLGQFLGKLGNFASGGWISQIPSQVSLAGVHNGVLRAAEKLTEIFPGLIVTSSTGGNHVANSYHYRGEALDIGGNTALLDRAAAWIKTSGMAKSLTEGIHNPNLAVKYGRIYDGEGPFGKVWANHRTHIHIAVAGALKGLMDFTETIRKGIPNVNTDKIGGLFGPLVNYFRGRMRKGLEKLAGDSSGSGDLPSGKLEGKGTAAIKRLAHQMVAQYFGESQWPAFDRLEMAEAGYDPFARNPDSGAFGIPQALPPTKMSLAAQRGDPVAQLKWMLKYIKDRYGTPSAAWGGYYQRGGWYARGGELPGADGMPLPIVAHAGEWILNKMQQSKVASAMGTTRDRLRGWLGFSGGRGSYAGGGEIDGRIAAATTFRGEPANTVEESFRAVNRLLRMLKKFNDSSKKFGKVLSSTIEQLDLLSTNLDNEQKKATARINRLSYHMKRNGIVVKANAVTLGELQEFALIDYGKSLREARAIAIKTRARVNARIKELRKGGIDKDEKDEFQRLVGARTAATNTIVDINDKIAQNVADIYNAQQELFQTRIDEATKGNATRNKAIQLGQRIAGVLGNKDDQRSLQGAVISNAQDQIRTLSAFLEAAKNQGNADMAEKIQDQIDDLNATIVETTAALLQSAIDEVNNQASQAINVAQRQDRLGSILQAAGDPLGAAQAHVASLVAIGAAQSAQRQGLLGLLGTAQAEGNIGVADALREQIAELDVSIAENTQAQKDSVTALNQVSIDLIKTAAAFRTGIFGSLQNIVNAVGALSGTIDQNELRNLITATITTLTGAGQGLAGQLLSLFGIDVTGLHGVDLVRAIEGLNIALIEQGMSEAQKQQFEGLITSIIDNETALLQNTQQLKDLNATLVQNFSSDQWLAFRQAVFNGAGGLVPQYQLAVPALAMGGVIEKSGLAYVHMGEEVISKARRSTGGVEKFEQTINITEPMEVADPVYFGNKIAFETSLGKVNQ